MKRFLIPITFIFALVVSLLAVPPYTPAAEKANILLQLVNELTSTNTLSTAKDNLTYRKTWAITDGTGVNKAETIFRDRGYRPGWLTDRFLRHHPDLH